MRPIRLSIEGLRSFRTSPPTIVDFEGRDHLAIVGDTGAGKSSLLEAMTYALYGQTSFSGHASQELMNDGAGYLRVAFSFWADDYVWEAVRGLTRRPGGETGGQTATLSRYGDADETLETVEGVKEVNRRAAALLGLDAGAFLRTIVLPQGRFARLLSEDEPRSRARILRQIWRTDDLDAAGAAATAALEAGRTLGERLAVELDHHPEDPRARLAELRAEAARTAGAAERETARAAALEARARTVRETRETRERIEAALETARGARPDAGDVRAVAAAARGLDERQRTAEREGLAAEAAVDASPAPEAGAREAAGRMLEAVRDARAAAAEQGARERAQDEAVRAADEAAARLDAAEAALRDAVGAEAEAGTADRISRLAAEAEAARERIAALAGQYDRYAYQAREPALAARADAETLERRAVDTLAEATAAAGRWQQAEARRAGAEEALAAVRRREAASHAAEGHEPGDPCPVCARALPADWSRPPGTDTAAALDAAGDADRAAREAQALAARTAAAAKQAARDLGAAEERAAKLEAEERRQLAALLAATDAPAGGECPPRDEALRPLEAAVRASGEALEALRGEAARLRTAAEVAAAAVRDARAAHVRAATEATRRRNAAAEARAAALEAGEALRRLAAPEEAGILAAAAGPADPGALDAVERSAKDRARAADEAADAHAAATARLGRAAQALAVLDGDRRALVAEPLARALAEAGRCRERLHEAAVAAGAGTAVPRLPLTPDPEEAERAIARVAEAAGQVEAHCRERLAEAAGAERAARHEAAAAAPGGEADPEALAADAARTAERARSAAEAAAGEAGRFAARVGDIERLRALAARAAARTAGIEELAGGLRPGGFPKWLTLRRSVDLLRHASRRLEEMSDGRYAFRDPRDTAEQWKVLDRWSGATRSPAALSGGEQFMASLALSLGMVETMGERGGRLECFFLDEGFGTLDRRTLDEALDALDRAATPDHMVGVITHVPEVAERMASVLLVERDPAGGSRARWLTDVVSTPAPVH